MSFNLQAAIDALPPNGGLISIPAETITLSQPLRVNRGKISLVGQGRASTVIQHGGWKGPIGVFGASWGNFTTAPSLATGPGNSIVLDGTNKYYINLRDSPTMELNGLDQFCLELFYRPTHDTTGEFFVQNIVASQGRRLLSEPISTTFTLNNYESNKVRASLNVGGILVALISAANALTVNSVHHLALTYDGSAVRLFVNGIIVASSGAAGTLSQQPHEDITLGVAVQDWPETTYFDQMARGQVDGLRVSKTARYTADFTPPTSKPTVDSNTLVLLNFDSFSDIFVVGQTSGTPGPSSQVWLPFRKSGVNTLTEIDIRDLQFSAANLTGVYFFGFQTCRIERVLFVAPTFGPFFWNNSFLTHLRDVKVQASGMATSRGGICYSTSGALSFDGLISLIGGIYPFVSTGGSAIVNNLFIAPNQFTRISALIKGRTGGNSIYLFNQISVDDEPFIPAGFVRPIECNVALDDVAASFYGGTLELVAQLPSPLSNIWIDHADASFMGTKFTNVSADPMIKFKSAPTSRLVSIRDSTKPVPNAWADDLSKCLIENSP